MHVKLCLLISAKTASSFRSKVAFVYPLFPSVCCFLFFAMFPVTQTRHYALDPDRAKETPNMLHLHKATGQVLYAAFPTQKTKLIFDSDWCSDFLSPAPPWRTKEFSCYLWTFATTLNSTPQHQSEHGTPQEIQVVILKVTKEKLHQCKV